LACPYAAHAIDIGKDEQFKPDFLKISPNNRIPAIVDRDNGLSLMESGAILIYLADKTGKLLAKDGEKRYRAIEWLMWQMGGPGPMLWPGASLREIQQGQGTVCRGALSEGSATGSMACSTGGSPIAPYVADDYSIADIAIWPWVSRFEWQTIDMNQYPNVKRWYLAIAGAPGGAEGLQGSEGRRRNPPAGVRPILQKPALSPLYRLQSPIVWGRKTGDGADHAAFFEAARCGIRHCACAVRRRGRPTRAVRPRLRYRGRGPARPTARAATRSSGR
jgi:GST-like protein